MSRRSTPKATLDERRFPIRMRVAGPTEGGEFGALLPQVCAWLEEAIGRGRYALHPAGRAVVDGTIVQGSFLYLMDPHHAAEFFKAFPTIQLARLPCFSTDP